MNKRIKKILENAFEAPEPQRKTEFLKRISSGQTSEMSHLDFVLSQLGYIRKRVWTLNILLLMAAFLLSAAMPGRSLWIISSVTPIMAVTTVTESGRSERFGMSELEMSARFSLQSVIFTRLVIMGITNFFAFAILWGIAGVFGNHPPLRMGVYILCPYCVTSYLCLCVTRKMRSQSSLFICTAIALIMSAVPLTVPQIPGFFVLAENHFVWITAVFVLSALGAAKEYFKMIKTEEFEWNL